MSKFNASWNKYFQDQNNKGTNNDMVATVNESFINQFLEKHRTKDADKYFQHVQLPLHKNQSGDMTTFDAYINVGGLVKETGGVGKPDNSVKKPFKIDFNPDLSNYNSVVQYDYKIEQDISVKDVPPETFPNIALKCEQIGILLKYPKADSNNQFHKVMLNIDIALACRVDFVMENGRTSVKFVPTSVHVGPSILGTPGNPVQDLVIVLVNYIMKEQAPKLIREFEIPVFEVGKNTFVPQMISIDNDNLSLFMVRDTQLGKKMQEEVESHQNTYLDFVDEDMAKTDDLVELLFGADVATQYHSTRDAKKQGDILDNATMLPVEEILPKATNHLKNYDYKRTSFSGGGVTDQNMGIAIVEDLLDSLLKDAVPGKKEKTTREVKVLNSIKGRIRTWMKIYQSDIHVHNNGRLEGSAFIDLGAMLEYKLREFYRCSTGWSSWKSVGLRLYGTPKLTAKVVTSKRGLGLDMTVSIKNLRIQTGLGRLIDKLVNVLFKLVKLVIDGLLKIVTSVLKFIIFPVKFELNNQKTAIKIAKFHQFKYDRKDNELRSNQNRYLSFIATAKGV